MYVAEISNIAQAILNGRGDDSTIDPGAFGKRLKSLGFVTEPRDAKGKKLRLTRGCPRTCAADSLVSSTFPGPRTWRALKSASRDDAEEESKLAM